MLVEVRKPSIEKERDDDERGEHDEADEGAAAVREIAGHLEGEQQDRLEDQEGDEVQDRAEGGTVAVMMR